MSKVKILSKAYPSQHIDIDIPQGSKNYAIVPDTIKISFYLDIESTEKASSVVSNVSRALVKKKVVLLASMDIDITNN